MTKKAVSRAIEIFRKHGNVMRTHQAIQAGISPHTLYEMRDQRILAMLDRGLFRLADAPPLEQPDLVRAALGVPKGVICLISALEFHNLTTEIPHQVYLALPNDAEKPRITYPPLRLIWLSDQVFNSGIEVHQLDHIPVHIYSREKTIADCFKFRNKIGVDVAREALREGLRQGCKVNTILEYARIDHVEKIMKAHLESYYEGS